MLKVAPPTNVNKLNTKVRILEALHDKGLNPKDAYTIEKVLVIPPRFRPIYPLPSGDLHVSDINKHYLDVGLKARGLDNALKENLLTEEEIGSYKAHLVTYDAINTSGVKWPSFKLKVR
jgi:DNA-directed RNA polymerase beta' subunit